jgi:hypothetical protein
MHAFFGNKLNGETPANPQAVDYRSQLAPITNVTIVRICVLSSIRAGDANIPNLNLCYNRFRLEKEI